MRAAQRLRPITLVQAAYPLGTPMRYNSSTDRTVAWTDTYSTSYVTGDIAGSPKTEHRGDYSMRKCTHSSDEIRFVGCHRVTQSGDPSPMDLVRWTQSDGPRAMGIQGWIPHAKTQHPRGASMHDGTGALGRPRTPSRYHTRLSKRYTTHQLGQSS